MANSFEGNSSEKREGQQAGQSGATSPDTTTRWKPATRVAFRFCFAYLALFSLSGQIFGNLINSFPGMMVPFFGGIWPMRQVTLWTATHVFHLGPILHPWGGDTVYGWVQTFCILIIALVATVVWSILDRHRQNYATLHKWFRLFVRFALASQMFIYGFSKIIPNQMHYPLLRQLVKPYGTFSPMSVLWTSIGSAPAYEMFTGCAEVLGGLLLILPVTTTLGALVCLADITQVFMLNMTYDVPVKILSFHLLLLSLFLIAPDLRRLATFFFTQSASSPSPQSLLFRKGQALRIALAAQMLLGIYLAGFNAHREWQFWHSRWGQGGPKPEFYGIWDVERMAIDGQVHPPLLTDSDRWRRVVFDSVPLNDVAVQHMDDTFVDFTLSKNAKGITLKDTGLPWIGIPGNDKLTGDFTFFRPARNELIINGSMGGHKIHAELKRVDLQKFTLVNRGFHWVNEYAYQR
jgi:uncharacterized membrane protein YphA (DoxX/SURF4 family)